MQPLLATTILAGSALLAGAVTAQTAGPKPPFTAFIDGDAQSYFALQSGNQNNGTANALTAPAANSHGRALGMVQNAEIRFTFQAAADNGLTYGWFVRTFTASSTIAIDGFIHHLEDIFLRSPDWGQLQFGNNSHTGKTAFPYTQCDYGPLLYVNGLCPDGGAEQQLMSDPNALGLDAVMVHLGADAPYARARAMGLYYATPVIHGFYFQFDYGPDGTFRNEEQFTTGTAATVQSVATKAASKLMNISGFAGHYTWAAGAWSGKMGIGVNWAEGKYVYTDLGRAKAISDVLVFQAAGSVQWRDVRFAFDYSWKGKSASMPGPSLANPTPAASNKPTAWGYSLLLERYSYAIYQPDDKGPSGGDWGYGVWYQFARDAGPYTTNGIWELNYFGIGGGYWLASGLQIFGEAFYYGDWNTHDFGAGGNVSFGTPAAARHPHGQIIFMGVTVEW